MTTETATNTVSLGRSEDDRYKWVALSNTTLGTFLATLDSSIMLIALPNIFRGIHLDPLSSGNSFFLLWMILSYLIVTSVLVVSFGRLGDMFGRVRMYSLGFAVYTGFSLLLSVTWMSGSAAGIYIILMRVFQGVGAAFLLANSGAILTDAFPEHQRGMALGVNQVVGIGGSFIGLVAGGVLAPIEWRLVFLVSVPVGLYGTVRAYRKLREVPRHSSDRIDWAGNITFALGLTLVMVGITYGIRPYGHHTMGWTSPMVLLLVIVGLVLLLAFVTVERRARYPMFRLQLFRLKAFTAGSIASLLANIGRGGFMFLLIIWLQGIWLPLHGYSFDQTPLWAGIYMLPLSGGFLCAGPISGILSDRYGSRVFATGGLLLGALSFFLLELLPVNFSFSIFGVLLFINGMSMGAFGAPNRAGVMNSLPAQYRGVGSGMYATFQNSAQVLSIGIYFSLMIIGLASTLSTSLFHGLTAAGVSKAQATRASNLPPVSSLFAAFLGVNPMRHLLGPSVLAHLAPGQASVLTSRSYFSKLISNAFRNGLHAAFDFSIAVFLLGAGMSWLRGGKYIYKE